MTTSHTTSPPLRVIAGTDTITTPHKTIRGFFGETEDDIMDDPDTTNSNNTQNETTPTQPIPKTIGKNGKNQINIHRPVQGGEATNTKIFQRGYNQLNLSPVPAFSHKSIVPTTPNTLQKQKLHQVTPTIMAPLSTQTTKNFLKVCKAYNVLKCQSMDGTLTIEKLETILVCMKNVGEYHYIDLTNDTPVIPDQKETTFTGNLDIRNEPTPGGRLGNTANTMASRELFGNTTPSQAPTNPAVAAKDLTIRSTTEQTSARSDRREEQEYTNAMQNSIQDITTVTPNNNASTGEKKRDRVIVGPDKKKLGTTNARRHPTTNNGLSPNAPRMQISHGNDHDNMG
jgi:hypothetical protein